MTPRRPHPAVSTIAVQFEINVRVYNGELLYKLQHRALPPINHCHFEINARDSEGPTTTSTFPHFVVFISWIRFFWKRGRNHQNLVAGQRNLVGNEEMGGNLGINFGDEINWAPNIGKELTNKFVQSSPISSSSSVEALASL